MVERIINLFHKEFSGLHEAAFLLGGFAIVSQILALVRDRLLANSFGAGEMLDIYYAAFRIPDLMFASVASFVSLTVLIPFLVKKFETEQSDAKQFISSVFSVFIMLIVAISTIVFFFIPTITNFLFPVFTEDMQSKVVFMTRILLLSPILFGISNLFGSVTQTFQKFLVYAIGPVLYNVGIIIGIVVLYPIFGLEGLAYGVVIGALLHAAVQLPVLLREGLAPALTFNINWKEIKEVAILSLPRTLGLSAHHITFLFLVVMAGAMMEGSITRFNLSFNLQSVPLSIIGVSYSVAAFPTLVRLFSKNEVSKFVDNVMNAMRHILFWSLPVVVLFIVLRAQIVRTILGSGEFSWADTRLTAAALAMFVVSLVAQSLVLLIVRGYYAAGNTKTPLIVNVASSIGIIIFAYLSIQLFESSMFFKNFIESLFRVEDIQGTTMLMLPFAYSIGMFANIGVLLFLFRRDFGAFPTYLTRTFWHSFSSAIFMGFVAYQFLQVFAKIFDLNTFIGIFMQGFLSGILGIIAGVVLLRLIGDKETLEIGRALHSKFWKTKAVSPEPEEL